jgi:hypothetical protein
MLPRVIVCALAVVALVGCCSNPHGHSGQLVAELNPSEKAATETAPYKATYVLYRWRNPPEGAAPETWTADEEVERLYLRGLRRWDKVGFERNDKGQLFAVAGEEKIPLQDGHYCWHITPETEYRGMERILHEAGENVVSIAALPFVVVGSAVAAAVLLPVLGVYALVLVCSV